MKRHQTKVSARWFEANSCEKGNTSSDAAPRPPAAIIRDFTLDLWNGSRKNYFFSQPLRSAKPHPMKVAMTQRVGDKVLGWG
jgi:hypothetical protein